MAELHHEKIMRQPSPGPAFRNNAGGWTLGAGHAGPREQMLGLGADKSGPWAGPSSVWASRKALASPWVGAEEPRGQRPRRGPVRVARPREGTVPGAEWDGNADWSCSWPGAEAGAQESGAGHWGFPPCEVIPRLAGLWGRKGPAGIAPAGGQDLAWNRCGLGRSLHPGPFPSFQGSRPAEVGSHPLPQLAHTWGPCQLTPPAAAFPGHPAGYTRQSPWQHAACWAGARAGL